MDGIYSRLGITVHSALGIDIPGRRRRLSFFNTTQFILYGKSLMIIHGGVTMTLTSTPNPRPRPADDHVSGVRRLPAARAAALPARHGLALLAVGRKAIQTPLRTFHMESH